MTNEIIWTMVANQTERMDTSFTHASFASGESDLREYPGARLYLVARLPSGIHVFAICQRFLLFSFDLAGQSIMRLAEMVLHRFARVFRLS